MLVVTGAFLLPAGGLGIELCVFKQVCGQPCFGCGLTRSVICTAHGQWTHALLYNPFGLLILPAAMAYVLIRSWPARRWREGLESWTASHPTTMRRLSAWILIVFLGFGVVRALALISGLWPWPQPW